MGEWGREAANGYTIAGYTELASLPLVEKKDLVTGCGPFE